MAMELTEFEKKLDKIIKNSKFEPKPSELVILNLQPAIHVLSKEEQIYFKNLTEPIFGYNEQLRNAKLKQLATDYHVILILPYLCTFIKDAIHFNLASTNFAMVIFALRMVKNLLANEHINLKPYLHEILPAVLSCGLADNIGKYLVDNHWSLRQFVALLVASICDAYSDDFNNIKQKVIGIYVKGLVDDDKGLITAFGAIKGLNSLGEEEVNNHLIPKIRIVAKKIQMTEAKYRNFANQEHRYQRNVANIVESVLVTVCAPILYKTRNVNDGGLTYVRDFGYLGKLLYIQVKNIEKVELAKQAVNFLPNQSIVLNSANENPNLVLIRANGNQNLTLTGANINQNIVSNQANRNQNVMPNSAFFNAVNITPDGPAPNNS